MSKDKVNFEMLTDAADNWAEGTLHLPVNSIVKHIQENHGLISDEDILVTQKLHKYLLH